MALSSLQDLIGQTLTDLGAHYEVLILRFGAYELHVSCFARIQHQLKNLLSTHDYQSWDKQDHTHNDMYLNIANHGPLLIGQAVRFADISPSYDLVIILDNDVRIEIFNSNGDLRFSDDCEQWFFYKPTDTSYPYLRASNCGITQEFQK